MSVRGYGAEQIVNKLREADVLKGYPEAGGLGKLVSPARRRRAVRGAMSDSGVSERRACLVLSQ